MIVNLVYAGVGYLLGAFTPAVGRKIKSLFVKESKVVVPAVEAEVAAVEKKL